MKAAEFDAQFDAGKDVTALLEVARARRPGLEPKRVNVDFPAWMVSALDQEARKLGVTRQALIKFWLADRLERRDARSGSDAHSEPVATGRIDSPQRG